MPSKRIAIVWNMWDALSPGFRGRHNQYNECGSNRLAGGTGLYNDYLGTNRLWYFVRMDALSTSIIKYWGKEENNEKYSD